MKKKKLSINDKDVLALKICKFMQNELKISNENLLSVCAINKLQLLNILGDDKYESGLKICKFMQENLNISKLNFLGVSRRVWLQLKDMPKRNIK